MTVCCRIQPKPYPCLWRAASATSTYTVSFTCRHSGSIGSAVTDETWLTDETLLFTTGLQHQGIFRVSGSQVEVNDIKNSFERGEISTERLSETPTIHSFWCAWMWLIRSVCRPGNDPLIDEESNHDINSVAGVLKLYFRGLENPLFPKDRFNDLISCVREYHSVNRWRETMYFYRVVAGLHTHSSWKTSRKRHPAQMPNHLTKGQRLSTSSLTLSLRVSPATLQTKLISAAWVCDLVHYPRTKWGLELRSSGKLKALSTGSPPTLLQWSSKIPALLQTPN